MTNFDDTPQDPPEPGPSEPIETEARTTEQGGELRLGGDPISYAATSSAAARQPQPKRDLPEDLRVPWSWAHFIVFFLFAIGSFIVVQTALALYYAPHQHLTQKELEHYLLNKPEFLFGSNLIWYGLIFWFLYVTLGVLRGVPFWRSLGWKKLKSNLSAGKGSPWAYFLTGCGLALFVAIASSQVHGTENMPIQEVLKNRSSAMLLMAMAVFVAPLVEETVFRGYLYPLFAKSFGMVPAVLLTGLLFGLMHGTQLGWSWGIVGLLILVGVIFTFARAYTGTVVASYLLHLGYNSMIAVATIIGTRGFTHLPPR